MLRINFDENIQTVSPLFAKSTSEKFLTSLIYEGLFGLDKFGNTLPALLEEYKVDSLRIIHYFKLKPSVVFHNGNVLSTKHIYHCFKRIIDSKENNSHYELFRSDLSGYRKYQLRKAYKIGYDSLPSGFRILDDHTFSMEFIEPKNDLPSLLALPDFRLYENEHDSVYVGTGPYLISHANEDISYALIKNKKYQEQKDYKVDAINIRFIKTKEAEISEFLNGSFDILINKPYSSYSNDKNQGQLSRYGKFNKLEGSLTRFRYLSINNMSSPTLKKLMIHLLSRKKATKTLTFTGYNQEVVFDNTYTSEDSIDLFAKHLTLTDSTPKIKIPFILSCELNCEDEVKKLKNGLLKHFELFVVTDQQINPNAPYIVLEESEFPLYTEYPNDQTLLRVLNEAKKYKSSEKTILLLDYERELIFSNINLKGLEPYTNWKRCLENVYFTTPKTF